MLNPASVEHLMPIVASAALLGAAGPRRVRIRARTFPATVQQGDKIQIQAIAVDAETDRPVRQDALYIQILDRQGREVYPKSTMARGQSGFVIEISSAELPQGEFQLNVSNNRRASTTDGHARFVVAPPTGQQNPGVLRFLPAATIPVIFQPIARALSTPAPPTTALTSQARVAPVVPLLTDDETIGAMLTGGKIRFVTELDRKVCPVCQRFEGLVYNVADPLHLRPTIPIHPNCRCHYEVVGTA